MDNSTYIDIHIIIYFNSPFTYMHIIMQVLYLYIPTYTTYLPTCQLKKYLGINANTEVKAPIEAIAEIVGLLLLSM